VGGGDHSTRMCGRRRIENIHSMAAGFGPRTRAEADDIE
jgi:hypothetical protein